MTESTVERRRRMVNGFTNGTLKRAAEGRCSLCRLIKPASDFYLSNINVSGLHSWCKECSDRRTVENERKRVCGVTPERVAKLFAEQDGRCAICGTDNPGRKARRFHVDHNHSTGVARGLLCRICNLLLGAARDDLDVLRAAITYLERHADEHDCENSSYGGSDTRGCSSEGDHSRAGTASVCDVVPPV